VSKADCTVTAVSTDPSAAPVALAAYDDTVAWASKDTVFQRRAKDVVPSVLASGLAGVRAVAIDATNVYWADGPSGTIAGAPVAGGAPFTLVTGAPLDGGLAADGGSAYWGAGGILFAGSVGFAPEPVAQGGGPIVAIATAPGHVAWIENDPSGATLRVPAGLGAVTTIGPTPAFGMLAATTQGAYVFDAQRSLQLVSWVGGSTQDIGSSDYAVGGLAVGESTAYYTAPSAGQIFQVLVP